MSLEVTFAGKKLKSPIGVAPHAAFAPPGIDPERVAGRLLRYVEKGAGFVYTPVIRSEPEHPKNLLPTGSYQLARTSLGRQGLYTIADRERIQNRLASGLRLIDILKKRLPADIPVIVNFIVPASLAMDPEAWASHAKRLEAAGADFLEINASCPLPASVNQSTTFDNSQEVLPYSLEENPEQLARVIDAISREITVPLGVKISAELGYRRLVNSFSRLASTNLKFVAEVNSPIGVAPPDIYNGGRGKYPGHTQNPFAAVVGPWLRYVCYRNAAALAKYVPSLDVAAIGGLVNPEHVVEVIMLGAKLVELSSGILFHGDSFIEKCTKFLIEFMETQGYASIDEFRGLALPYIVPISEVQWPLHKMAARIREDKCNSCGICAETLCYAITMQHGKPSVSIADCGACGLCIAICPRQAIELHDRSTGISAAEHVS